MFKLFYMKKNRFFGIYYKYQTVDGYTIAVISSTANEGDMLQRTPDNRVLAVIR